jgi:hypothetical protein
VAKIEPLDKDRKLFRAKKVQSEPEIIKIFQLDTVACGCLRLNAFILNSLLDEIYWQWLHFSFVARSNDAG